MAATEIWVLNLQLLNKIFKFAHKYGNFLAWNIQRSNNQPGCLIVLFQRMVILVILFTLDRWVHGAEIKRVKPDST